MASTINQANKVFLQAKRIHICGVHLELLPQSSSGGSCLLVTFVFYLNLFFSKWLLPLSHHFLFWVACTSILVYTFNSKKDMYSSLVTTLDENLIQGLPNMHGVFLVILTHERVFISRGRLMRKSLVIYDPLGK